MRKVSKEIAQAFKAGKAKRYGNTTTNGNEVRLHGNLIARRDPCGCVYVTLAGWNSPTTRERVNTILNYLGSGIYVTQKNFEVVWHNLPINAKKPSDSSAWIKVE